MYQMKGVIITDLEAPTKGQKGVLAFNGPNVCFSNSFKSKFVLKGTEYKSVEEYLLCKKAKCSQSGNKVIEEIRKVRSVAAFKRIDKTIGHSEKWFNKRLRYAKIALRAKACFYPDGFSPVWSVYFV